MKLKITTYLIIANVIFFFLSLLAGVFSAPDCSGICKYLALQPKEVFENYYFWTLLTSMFMHAGFAHLFFNMFSLFFIGKFLERIIGGKRFLWFYLISGVFAGFFFSVLSYLLGYGLGEKVFGNPSIIAVGASGALFGLLGILAVLTPRNRVYLIAGPLIAIVIQAIADNIINSSSILFLINIAASIYILFSIFSIFSVNPRTRRFALPLELEFWLLPIVAIVPLVIIGFLFPLPIGNMAHLSGLLSGLVYGFYLRKRYRRKVALLSRYFR